MEFLPNHIVNNGQISMTPNTSMTTTVTGTISGAGIFSTKMSTTPATPSTVHFAASFAFTGPGPVGTLYMKQVADSNHLRNLTVNSPGGLILGNPVIVDTTLTLTAGTVTNGSNLTLGTNVKINRAAGSLSAAPTFGSSISSLVYNDVVPTTTGFEMPSSASVLKSLSINNAAGVTLNSSPVINDTLKLLLGNLTIPATQTLRIASGLDILGAPFSSTKYIITDKSGSNIGKLRVDNISTAKYLPIGTAAYFLPVTLTPLSTMDFETSVFSGATDNGLLTGNALTTLQKDRIVDAVWTINRIAGTGTCDVQTSWDPALEGPAFSAFSNTSIGMARHNGTGWDLFIGSGDNTTNTATASFADFSPFLVGELATVLPVTFKSVNATIKATGIEINWKVENEIAIASYEIERSKNGYDFTGIGFVDAANRNSYSYTDATVLAGVFYYRIKIISTNGSFKYSTIVNVKQSNNAEINIYPNPVANSIFINGLKKNATINIVNTVGQIVLKQNVSSSTISLDVSRFKAGVYTIQIVSEDEKLSRKIVIKK
ncbi:MAG: T9SS type A sorting domain-containing protein [Ferruginibacter sp.]